MANICKAIMTPRNGGNNEAAAAGRGFAGDQTWVSLLAADLRTQSCFCDALATPTWKQNNVDRKYFDIHFFRERRIQVKIKYKFELHEVKEGRRGQNIGPQRLPTFQLCQTSNTEISDRRNTESKAARAVCIATSERNGKIWL